MLRYALSISTNGSADINSISKQIFCQSEGIEKIINKNMVIFADQGSSKIADNAVSESLSGITIALFSRVDLQIANEAVRRICACPHFNSPLHWFNGIYCFRDSLPLKGIIASLIETFFDGLYSLFMASTIESRIGHTLNNFSWFACPRGNSLLLSFR